MYFIPSIHPSILSRNILVPETLGIETSVGYLEIWYRIVLMLKRLGPYRVPFYYLFPIYGYPKFIFGHPKIFLDIDNSFLDIQKPIYGYPKIHFWISRNQLITGYP